MRIPMLRDDMYCPKCEKTIKRERIAEVNLTMKEKFNSNNLEKGLCPVCGTRLFDLSKKEAKKDED
jgi:ssDNA-binding Zn-finger/Zn-ribbon topoisomerase 1